MVKIQFDTINGVVKVKNFDDGITMIDRTDIMRGLREAKDRVLYGCDVGDADFEVIAEKYGVH